jgi:O-antigen/teichoic acid export membrane protein
VVSYGAKLSGINAIGMVNERVGLLSLAVFATDAAIGVYSVAVAGGQILLLVTESLVLSTFRHIGRRSWDSSASLTLRTIRHTSLLATVGGLLLFPIGVVAVPVVLGPGYTDVPLLFAVLIPAGIGYAVIQPLLTFFQVRAQRPALVLAAASTALVVNILLALALTAPWGTWGAATATSLSSMFGAATAFWFFCRETGMGIRDLRPGRQELRDYAGLVSSLTARFR